MSRIGKQPIAIPAGVKVSIKDGQVFVEGSKGQKLAQAFHRNMSVVYDEKAKVIRVERPDDARQNRALHGLTRSLIANMILGVTKGYEKRLKIEGIGYQARLDKKSAALNVGYANTVTLTPPDSVTVEVPDANGVSRLVRHQAGGWNGAPAGSGHPRQRVGPFAGCGVRQPWTIRRQNASDSSDAGTMCGDASWGPRNVRG